MALQTISVSASNMTTLAAAVTTQLAALTNVYIRSIALDETETPRATLDLSLVIVYEPGAPAHSPYKLFGVSAPQFTTASANLQAFQNANVGFWFGPTVATSFIESRRTKRYLMCCIYNEVFGDGQNNYVPGGTGGPAGGGSGSVVSVSLALPASLFSVSGNPVTNVGTLGGALIPQTPNTIFAGPPSGGAVAPTFRSLVGADFPTLTIPVGAINATGTANATSFLRGDGSWALPVPILAATQVGFGSVANLLTGSNNLTWIVNTLTLKATLAQTANLQEWQQSTGFVAGSVGGDGATLTLDGGTGPLPAVGFISNEKRIYLNGPDTVSNMIHGLSFGSNFGNEVALNLFGRNIGGTRAAPTATQDGHLVSLRGSGYSGVGTIGSMGSKITYIMISDGLWSPTNNGTYHQWRDTTTGQTSTTESMRLQAKTLMVGTIIRGSVAKLMLNLAVTVDNLAVAQFTADVPANKALVVQAAAAQTANLQEWQISSGVARVFVGPDGVFSANRSGAVGNEIFGNGAGSASITGVNNTALGATSLTGITTATDCTAIGFQAGAALTSGNFNTFIGSGATTSAPAAQNSTALGYGATVTTDNQVVLGNGSVTQTVIRGFANWGTQSVAASATISAPRVKFTGALAGQTLTFNAGMPVGSDVFIRNAASVAVTVAAAGGTTIEGAASLSVAPGVALVLTLVGTDWTIF